MTKLTIERRETEGIIVLDLKGPLILGDEDVYIREYLRLLVIAGTSNVALNLANVGRIDSTGLGTLVAARVRLGKAGGSLALFNLQPAHLDLLTLTKLLTVFEVFAAEHDAISSYFPERVTHAYDVLTFVRDRAEADSRAQLHGPPVPVS